MLNQVKLINITMLSLYSIDFVLTMIGLNLNNNLYEANKLNAYLFSFGVIGCMIAFIFAFIVLFVMLLI